MWSVIEVAAREEKHLTLKTTIDAGRFWWLFIHVISKTNDSRLTWNHYSEHVNVCIWRYTKTQNYILFRHLLLFRLFRGEWLCVRDISCRDVCLLFVLVELDGMPLVLHVTTTATTKHVTRPVFVEDGTLSEVGWLLLSTCMILERFFFNCVCLERILIYFFLLIFVDVAALNKGCQPLLSAKNIFNSPASFSWDFERKEKNIFLRTPNTIDE